ncbi:uncharacterized protein LOC133531859 [Cydia pomonella]|uniref:uncharacterized protein LOC133531859 n=1 Tax=Cydia pomonella TaxID=82600 RepID=UPI002ADDD3E5|nr:uncharacterized protein LOC133531859 [Cydia pomonella]
MAAIPRDTRGTDPSCKSVVRNTIVPQVESLLKESIIHQPNEGNYSWLKSRQTQHDYSKDLDVFKPMVSKMSSESCASIAVKLDNLTEGDVGTAAILGHFKRLLLEQHSLQLIESVTRTKNRKRNRVCPDLGERQPIVSFILD